MENSYYDPTSPAFVNNKRVFLEFLDENEAHAQKLEAALRAGRRRLLLDLGALRAYNEQMERQLIERPLELLAPWQAALKTHVLALEDASLRKDVDEHTEFAIGVEGSLGANRVTPRLLGAHHLSQLVCVEGIVTRCSIVRPKAVRTTHFCEATGEFKEASYHDATSIAGFPTGSIYPTRDANGNPYTTEFGLSEYRDHQTVTIQEMPERAPAGELPSSVDVVLDDDLVDACKPGDRVAIVGVFRALPSRSGHLTTGVFKPVLIANNVRQLQRDHTAAGDLTPEDEKHIRQVAKRGDVFELLARSLAPSIYGLDYVKRAMVLLLLGGVERNSKSGMHIRGDINILMVGDPSTAKSQFLRFVLNIAPLAINTTGRGSSGVGLTAAVVADRETGERRLEAGAMVLADRGIVCIDEFDKMSETDRVAIHEVMEQQTVTIAKAGIHMSLNARCSVVAAANPIYGQYDRSRKPVENVNLPDSILSRFDLLFIVLDTVDPETDRAIAEHVVRNHRSRGKPERAVDDADEDEEKDDGGRGGAGAGAGAGVYERADGAVGGGPRGARGRGAAAAAAAARQQHLTLAFLKKYVQFAKRLTPTLTDEAVNLISDAYAELRSGDRSAGRAMPITPRALDTIVRLSSAHAKAYLREEVAEADVRAALQILHHALNNDVSSADEARAENDEARRAAAAPASPARAAAAAAFSSSSAARPSSPRRASPAKPKRPADAPTDEARSPVRRRVAEAEAEADGDEAEDRSVRFSQFVSGVSRALRRTTKLHVDALLAAVNAERDSPFERAEAMDFLREMQDDNKIMIFKSQEVHRL
jgi:DNA replication licensing factor MCM3